MRADDSSALAAELKAQALGLGFDLAGIAPAFAPPGHDRLRDWLTQGYAAGMTYLERHAELRSHPRSVLPEVRSILMVAASYRPRDEADAPRAPLRSSPGTIDPPDPDSPPTGRVARYARGRDYHQVIWKRLDRLADWLKTRVPGATARGVADTAPLSEREFARLAGLGWIGKNTMLINTRWGSYTFLGALLTNLDLPPDPPHETNHCGSCTRCLEACPTGAFPEPGVLDARRCIAYWTIEHKGPWLPAADLNPVAPHGWLFGCDICQEVCPWNRKAPGGTLDELQPLPEWNAPVDLLELVALPPAELARRLKPTAMTRTKRSGLIRNTIHLIAEACQHAQRRVDEHLPSALADDPDLVVSATARAVLAARNDAGPSTSPTVDQGRSSPA